MWEIRKTYLVNISFTNPRLHSAFRLTIAHWCLHPPPLCLVLRTAAIQISQKPAIANIRLHPPHISLFRHSIRILEIILSSGKVDYHRSYLGPEPARPNIVALIALAEFISILFQDDTLQTSSACPLVTEPLKPVGQSHWTVGEVPP